DTRQAERRPERRQASSAKSARAHKQPKGADPNLGCAFWWSPLRCYVAASQLIEIDGLEPTPRHRRARGSTWAHRPASTGRRRGGPPWARRSASCRWTWPWRPEPTEPWRRTEPLLSWPASLRPFVLASWRISWLP